MILKPALIPASVELSEDRSLPLHLNRCIRYYFALVFLGYVSTIFGALLGNQILVNTIRYMLVILFYALVATILWLNPEKLAQFHFDRATLILIVLFGFLRSRLDIPNEAYYQWSVHLLAVIVLAGCFKYWGLIPETHWRWVSIAILTCLVMIPIISIFETYQPYLYSDIHIPEQGPWLFIIRKAIRNLSFIVLFEETLFRGFLWGYGQSLGWKEGKIFWSQAILFWLAHLWNRGNPITFFITVPVYSLALSGLARNSKQLIPSITFHLIANTTGAILVYFLIR